MSKRGKQDVVSEAASVVAAHEPPAAEPEPAATAAVPPADGLRASHDHESLRQISLAEQAVAEAEEELEEAKRVARTRKNRWEAAVEDLRRTIREANREYPLFQGQGQPEPAPAEGRGPVVGEDDDAWRMSQIAELERHGLSVVIAVKLNEAGILTLGQLADWTAAGKRLTDIPGIGQAKAEQIENASAAFWMARAVERGEPDTDSDDSGDVDGVDSDDEEPEEWYGEDVDEEARS